MKKILFLFSLCAVFGIFMISCSSPYDPAPQILPEHIKKVYVRPFINNTNQFGIETKFTIAVTDEIMRDGRLSLVNTEAEADGILTATIKRYILQPLTYDANMVVEQYKMWVIVSVSLIDKDNNITLWTESNLEGIQIYLDSTKGSLGEGMTEEEAREIVWENLSRDIVKRTVKGFGSISSPSEKKVPV